MSKCNCPPSLESMHQLCASCQADYLRYLAEIESTEPETDQTRPATMAELKQLETWDFEQHLIAATAIGDLHDRCQDHTARLLAAETNLEAHRTALRAVAARIDSLAQAITNQAKGKAA